MQPISSSSPGSDFNHYADEVARWSVTLLVFGAFAVATAYTFISGLMWGFSDEGTSRAWVLSALALAVAGLAGTAAAVPHVQARTRNLLAAVALVIVSAALLVMAVSAGTAQ